MNNIEPFKRVTLKDIAKKTGYSVSAVSHALKDMPDISQEAKTYIKNCANRLDVYKRQVLWSINSGYTDADCINNPGGTACVVTH